MLDRWRLSLLQLLCRDAHLTVAQAAQVLAGLTFPAERVEAAALMWPRLVDPHNAAELLKPPARECQPNTPPLCSLPLGISALSKGCGSHARNIGKEHQRPSESGSSTANWPDGNVQLLTALAIASHTHNWLCVCL